MDINHGTLSSRSSSGSVVVMARYLWLTVVHYRNGDRNFVHGM